MNLIRKFIGAFTEECSKSKILKSLFPSLNEIYNTRVINSPNGLLFFRGYFSIIYYQYIGFWYYSPKLFTGGFILNLLGLQVIRHYLVNYILRPNIMIKNKYKKLQDEGVQIEKQFLNQSEVEHVINFYRKNEASKIEYLRDFSELIIYSNLPHIQNPSLYKNEYADLYKWLNEKINFASLFKDFAGKDMRSKPFISIIHNKHFHKDDSFEAQADGNARPHRDVFYSSYKIFIYLSDVCKDNAAFTYYPGSHKENDSSLSVIYKNSVDYYKSGKKLNIEETNFSNNVPFCCEGNAGDAVFFNVRGVHKRGQFRDNQDRERLVMLIDFRQSDALVIKRENIYKEQ